MICKKTLFLFKDIAKTIKNNIICNECLPTKFTCDCGKRISINSVYRHENSKRHQIYLNQQNNQHNNFRIDLN